MNDTAKPILDRVQMESDGAPPREVIEHSSENLRYLAMYVEDGFKKGAEEMKLPRPQGRVIIRALWDLADRVELD